MDEIQNFYNFKREFKRTKPLRGVVSGNPHALVVKNDTFLSRKSQREFGQGDTTYIERGVQEEQERMMQIAGDRSKHDSTFETLSEEEDGMLTAEDQSKKQKILKKDDGIYTKFDFDLERDSSLPVHDSREEILDLINKNPVVILQGDTGCGKSTQVPQYILDNAYQCKEYCKIVVTQPRRLAAISIAHRVSQERGWEVGSVVGYKVGLHQETHEDSRILYCTTGVLLQRLISEKSLDQYTHIVLDEVHERDQDMDFLLILVRRLLVTVSRHVKIILMSATINAKQYAKYFKIGNKLAPILHVNHRQLYSVETYYLDDCVRINANNLARICFEEPGISNEMYHLVSKLLVVIGNIELNERKSFTGDRYINAAVLIFLPGIHEINELYRKLEKFSAETKMVEIKLFPIRLHSMISTEEQQKIFDAPPMGTRKIILATNIAESSITVPDVKYVIDFCLTKSIYSNTSDGFSSLHLQWASKANCRQRAGRAGRVMNGRVYRLIDKYTFENHFQEYETPEILRCPLESVVLKAKLLDMGTPPEIIGLAMDPPFLEDIHNTILSLKEMGALFVTARGRYSIDDGDLSFLGRTMAQLPLDPRMTRLIMLGYAFSFFEEAIIMAAGLTVRSIFESSGMAKKSSVEAYYQKMLWAEGSGSDVIAILQAYSTWKRHCQQGKITSFGEQRDWTRRFYLNLRALQEMHLLIQEITHRLQRLGIDNSADVYQRIKYLPHEKFIILKVIIAGAFYPNYFTRSKKDDVEYDQGIDQLLDSHDPCKTVYLRGFDSQQVAQLYAGAVRRLFTLVTSNIQSIQVDFLRGSERVYVTFRSNDAGDHNDEPKVAPGVVLDEVYKAIRMRTEKIPLTVEVMDPSTDREYAQKVGLGRVIEGTWVPKTQNIQDIELIVCPSLYEKSLRGCIVHIDTCSKFFVRPEGEDKRLQQNEAVLQQELEMGDFAFGSPSEVDIGMVAAAPFKKGNYFRVQVMQLLHRTRGIQFRVKYIDYGNSDDVDFAQLRRIPSCLNGIATMPPRCFQCRLAKIQPSSMAARATNWHSATMELLQMVADAGPAKLEIYSVVNLVVSVEVVTEDGANFNKMLVEKGYAQYCQESYMSMKDHDFRSRKQAMACCFVDLNLVEENEVYMRSLIAERPLESDPPPNLARSKTLTLRGPFTPLETKVFSAIRTGATKTVNIERESINSILLDHNPQSQHEQLLIAANITGSQSSNGITARSTTLGPNIHGFGAFMTMLFTRSVQLKTNTEGSKFVSLLAGLGINQDTGEPLFEEHDIVMDLDVDVLVEDIETINRLRHKLDEIFYIDAHETSPNIDKKSCANKKAHIKNLIIKLLNKQRQYVESQASFREHVWELRDPKNLIGNDSVYGERAIFPLHKIVALKDERHEIMIALREHCASLHRTSRLNANMQPVVCRLCNQEITKIGALRIHLLSQLHKNREKQIKYDPKVELAR